MGMFNLLETKARLVTILDSYDLGLRGIGPDLNTSFIYATAALTPLGITTSTNASSPSSTTFAGGTLIVDAPNDYNTPYGTGTGGTINQNSYTATFSGVFSGTGALTFGNSGTGGNIILSGTNTYTGATTVDAGAKLSVNGSIASSSGCLLYTSPSPRD